MWLRGQRRRLTLITPVAAIEVIAVHDGSPGPEESFGRMREMESLALAVKRLSATDREGFFECALGGMSYEHFGRERGLTRGGAKSRAHRAREGLLQGLEDHPRRSG